MKRSQNRIRSEQGYVLEAYKRLRVNGFPSRREAPVLGRSVDLVYLDGHILITIEFKLSDWRKGLLQARDHQIAGDYAYLCMPGRKPSTRLRLEASVYGVGLLELRPGTHFPFSVIQPASRSSITWTAIRERTIATLKQPTFPS